MSNFSLNKQKCWSCEYFCGKRQIKNGLLMGTSVQTNAIAIVAAQKAKKKREEERLAIKANEKKLKSLRSKPLTAGIIAGAIGLGAFFFSWIPHWSALFKKMSAEAAKGVR